MNPATRDLTALLVTATVRAVTVTLLLTVLWGTPAVSHLVQDIRTWRDFFVETQAGAIPYVNLTKEYPVLGGILYWLMSPFIRPDDLRQTIVVHAAFMGIADLINVVLFYRLAREIAPRWAFAATLALGLNLTAIVTAARALRELDRHLRPARATRPSTPPLGQRPRSGR